MSYGARVKVIYLPPRKDGKKVGLDDFFAAGGTTAQLLSHATATLRRPAGPTDSEEAGSGPYRETPNGLVLRKQTGDGVVEVPLANFTARITSEVAEDDGTEDVRRSFEIEAKVRNAPKTRVSVRANQFGSMNWVTEHLGAGAIVYPGFGAKDHARTAIQMLSRTVAQRRVYTHTGWRKIDGRWLYLHAAGALGESGAVQGIEVRLPPALAPFVLPTPPEGAERVEAVRTTLRLTDGLGPPRVVWPSFAAIWRAVLKAADMTLSLSGPTGVFKSELAALLQQHWGAGFDSRQLPGSWLSTANANAALAFVAKDALLVVDDFAPRGTTYDVARQHRDADQLMRAQGNQAGRQRMRADTTLRPPNPPRGLIFSTGEDVPRGPSLRARGLILEVSPGEIDRDVLSCRQAEAAAGHYAQAMAAFLVWLAPRLEEEVWATWATKFSVERAAAIARCVGHPRTPGIVADLLLGVGWFFAFAHDVGALTAAEIEPLWTQAWTGLGEAAGAQPEQQAEGEPARRFLTLLSAALTSGAAHVATPNGGEPAGSSALGWRDSRAPGPRVGWVDGGDLYLEPEAALAAAQRLGREGGEGVPVGLRTLKKRLFEKGLLATTEQRGGKRRLEVRRTLAGGRREVLHLLVSSISLSEDDASGPSVPNRNNPTGGKEIPWATAWATSAAQVAQRVAQRGNGVAANGEDPGTPGRREREPGEDDGDADEAVGEWTR